MHSKLLSVASKSIQATVLIGTCFYLSGCDALLDCIDYDGPIFTTDTALTPATLNQVYSTTIRATVEREINDDRFDYNFTILDGALPPGISTESVGRSFNLIGTATELGTYNFELNVFVDEGLTATESGLCYHNRTRNFELEVLQQSN